MSLPREKSSLGLLARISHQVSSRGLGNAVSSGVFDLRDAQSYSPVRRASRCEKTLLGAVPPRPQQISGEICGLVLMTLIAPFSATAQSDPGRLADFAIQKAAQMRLQRSAAVERAGAHQWPVRQVWDDGTTMILVRLAGSRPLYLVTQNLGAADTVSSDEVWLGGTEGLTLDGFGQEAGLWDGGAVRESHQELLGRVNNLDEADFNNHSTRVAGMMLASGIDPAARGMASAGAIPRAHDFEDDVAEMAAEQMVANPVRLSNHSYANATGWWFDFFGDGLWAWLGDTQVSNDEAPFFGLYGAESADWDQIVYDSPGYLPVVAAGNDRDDSGPGAVLHWHFNVT